MPYPHAAFPTTTRQPKSTALGYQTLRWTRCRRSFNERTGTPFNFLKYSTDIVRLVVLWRLRYKLSLRDLAELFLERGFVFSHEAVREWEGRFAPLLAERLRAKRWGIRGRSVRIESAVKTESTGSQTGASRQSRCSSRPVIMQPSGSARAVQRARNIYRRVAKDTVCPSSTGTGSRLGWRPARCKGVRLPQGSLTHAVGRRFLDASAILLQPVIQRPITAVCE